MSHDRSLWSRHKNFKGARPISFYSWDFACILDVLDMVLSDEEECPDKEDAGYNRLNELYVDLKNEYGRTYG